MRFTSIMIVLLTATPAAAAEITRQGDVISISGWIESGDEKKFGDAAFVMFGFVPQATVILDSTGGDTVAAVRIGDGIRLLKYETRVHNGAICHSACALIWLAGAYRAMDPNACIGVHSAALTIYDPKGKVVEMLRADSINALIAEWLAEKGIPQPVIELVPKADPHSMNYISYKQAKTWGLINPRVAP